MLISRKYLDWGVPSIISDGISVPEEECVKLLGVLFDRSLLYHDHLRNVAVHASQRLGLLRRTSWILGSESLLRVYKGFVRPVMEYEPLVWMGAADTHLRRLECVQSCAARICKDEGSLDNLVHRRRVLALTFLFKIQYHMTHARLRAMVPPRFDLGSEGSRITGCTVMLAGHDLRLLNKLDAHAHNALWRSFPYCAVNIWNHILPELLLDSLVIEHMESFKVGVHCWLLDQGL